MRYSSKHAARAYDDFAYDEDKSVKKPSLRTEIPREFIKKYLKKSDIVLDAGAGTGINAIMMAKRCKKVVLLDISPRILHYAKKNIGKTNVKNKIDIIKGDISDLSCFKNGEFSFVVCVGDAISYVLEKRFKAIKELVRVAKKGSMLVIGCDSKYGFMRLRLSEGKLDEAIRMNKNPDYYEAFIGINTHLYTVDEMKKLIEKNGCKVLEIASTPPFSDTFDRKTYYDKKKWAKLKKLELELCTKPELIGLSHHLLFIARKL